MSQACIILADQLSLNLSSLSHLDKKRDLVALFEIVDVEKNKGVNMHCDNCGHNAHCGVPLYEDAEDGVTGESYKYEICKHCRCNDCTPLDYGN